jgi:hypothetical protein
MREGPVVMFLSSEYVYWKGVSKTKESALIIIITHQAWLNDTISLSLKRALKMYALTRPKQFMHRSLNFK